VKVIISEESGLGKSHKIRKFANENDYNYVLFPISDEIDFEKLTKRLFDIQETKKMLLHLNLCQVDSPSLLNEFLFNLIILRTLYGFGESFIVPDDCMFYIEVANTLNNQLLDSLTFLQLFEIELITHQNKEPIEVSEDLSSPIQIVANYLYALETNTLDRKEIITRKYHEGWEVNVEPIEEDICRKLIEKYFLINNKWTFYQVNSFIYTLADALEKFSQSPYFMTSNIEYSLENTSSRRRSILLQVPEEKRHLTIRSDVLRTLLNHTKAFTRESFAELFEAQDRALRHKVTFGSQYSQEIEERKFDSEYEEKRISFSKNDHLLIVFNDYFGICPVYKKTTELPPDLERMLASQAYIKEDYSLLTSDHLNQKLAAILGSYSYKKSEEYILTADNFYKMILILLKVRAKIPVVIMGETGCGKTSLVRYLAQNHMNCQFEVINFHAGITQKILIEKLKIIKQRAQEILNSQELASEINLQTNQAPLVWVLLDEVNTCNCLGLISEVICFHSFLGEKMPDNVQFIATCNPYRLKKSGIEVGLVKNTQDSKTLSLAYTVNPLPHSLMNFVFDFGSLSKEDEILYIETMLRNVINNENLLKISSECIRESQEFIRNLEEASSVSLRETKRFVKFFRWFRDNMKQRQAPLNKKDCEWHYGKQLKGSYEVEIRAVVLSLFICYYLRLPNQRNRDEYLDIILKIWKKSSRRFDKVEDLIDVFSKEQDDYISRMTLPPGIALNVALRENIFSLIVCIVNKVPLIICGKPGCSKTLSVQLIYTHMRGPESEDPFFKSLPRLFLIGYQGSKSSTSEGIERVFERAQKLLKDSTDKNLIIMVFFDEIGLAELSKNNPLKVLHSLLEPPTENDDEKVAFVGISNWRLDASKMNRTIFLARPDPDEKDLIKTACSICDSYQSQASRTFRPILEALAKAYYRIQCENFKSEYSDFHGARDFYSLIKQVSSKLVQRDANKQVEDIVIEAVERNFGGIPGSIKRFKEILTQESMVYAERVNVSLPVIDLVGANLQDPTSRYLMIVSNSNYGTYILEHFFARHSSRSQILVGSNFDEDLSKEEYSFKTLSNIIIHMEKGDSIIMQNLDSIYPSLYDLFNQNFTIVSKRKNCRIALGSINNPMCYVNDNFRCTIIVDEKDVTEKDPPFLNRFEKQILTLDNIMTEEQKLSHQRLEISINDMTTSTYPLQFALNKARMILGLGEDAIKALIIKEGDKDEKEVYENIFSQIMKLSTMEGVIAIENSKLKTENLPLYEHLLHEYFHSRHQSLYEMVDSVDLNQFPNKCAKYVIYTYTSVLEKLNLPVKLFAERNIFAIKKEREIERFIREFFKGDQEILILRFQEEDYIHLNLVKFIIEKIIAERAEANEKIQKSIFIIIHLRKDLEGETHYFSFLSDWIQLTIDSLNVKSKLSFDFCFKASLDEIFEKYFQGDLQAQIKEMLNKPFMKLDYTTRQFSKYPITNYIDNIINCISKDEVLQQHLIKFICNEMAQKHDWKEELLCNPNFAKRNQSLLEILEDRINMKIEDSLTKIIYALERDSMLDWYVSRSEKVRSKKASIEKIFYQNFDNIKTNNLNLRRGKQENPVEKVWGMSIPGSLFEIQRMVAAYEKDAEKVVQLEDSIKIERDDVEQNIRDIKVIKKKIEKEIGNSTLSKQIDSLSKPVEKEEFKELFMADIINYFTQRVLKVSSEWTDLILGLYNLRFPNSTVEEVILWLVGNQGNIAKLLAVFISMQKRLSLNPADITQEFMAFCQGNGTGIPQEKYAPERINAPFNLSLDFLAKTSLPNSANLEAYLNNSADFIHMLELLRMTLHELRNSTGALCKYAYEVEFLVRFLLTIKEIGFEQTSDYIPNFLMSITNKQEQEFQISKSLIDQIQVLNDEICQRKELKRLQGEAARFLLIKTNDDSEKYEMINIIIDDNYLITESKNFIRDLMDISEFSLEDLSQENTLYSILEHYLDLSNIRNKEVIIEDIISSCYVKLANQNHPLDFLEIGLKVFSDAVDNFNQWPQFMAGTDMPYPAITVLHSIAIIKVYAQKYFTVMLNRDTKYQVNPEVIKIFNEKAPLNTNEGVLLRIFFLRELKEMLGSIARIENELFNDRDFEWIKLVSFTGEMKSLLDFEIIPLKNADRSRNVKEIFERLYSSNMHNETAMNQLLNNLDLRDDPVSQTSLALAVANKIYLKQHDVNWETSVTFRSLNQWMQENKLVENLMSPYLRILLISMLNNFRGSKLLNIRRETRIENIELSSVIIHAFSTFMSLAGTRNAYRELLSDDIAKIAKNLQTFYLPGAEDDVETIDDNYRVYKLIITTNKQVDGAAVGIYKCNCGFPYTIGECTQPMQTVKCPGCRNPIGGNNHQLIARNGHTKVTLEVNEARQKLNEILTKARPGYIPKDPSEIRRDQTYSIRNMKPIASRILKLFHEALFYGLIATDIVTDKALFDALKLNTTKYRSAEEYLRLHMEDDYDVLTQLLNLKHDTHLFLHILLGSFADFVQTSQVITTSQQRMEFEASFETNFLQVLLNNQRNEIQVYKDEAAINQGGNQRLLSPMELVKNSFRAEELVGTEYAMLPLWKTVHSGSYEEMKMAFMRNNLAETFPLIKCFFDIEEELKRLDSLPVIIKFTNWALQHFNFSLDREEARTMSIETAINKIAITEDAKEKITMLFHQFQEEWKKIYLLATQFGCKQLLPLPEITNQTPIGYILPDTIELGFGMYMASALEQLSLIQNQILDSIYDAKGIFTKYDFLKAQGEVKKIPVQSATSSEIICFSALITNNNKEELVQEFWMGISPDQDERVTDIKYDYQWFEEKLARTLVLGKKKLSPEYRFMQYKFEIYTSNSDMICQFRDKYECEDLTREQANILENLLKSKDDKEKLDMHTSAENLIYYVKNGEIEEELLSSVCENAPAYLNLSKLFVNFVNKESIRTSQLLSLYELIEVYSFEPIKAKILPQFKSELSEEQYRELRECKKKFKKLNIGDLIKALRRFCSRNLVNELKEDEKVSSFMRWKRDIWDKKVSEDDEILEEFEMYFPESIQVRHTFGALIYLEEESREKDPREDKIKQTFSKKMLAIAPKKEAEKKAKKYIGMT